MSFMSAFMATREEEKKEECRGWSDVKGGVPLAAQEIHKPSSAPSLLVSLLLFLLEAFLSLTLTYVAEGWNILQHTDRPG